MARILRPRGRRGEVAAEILTDFPERLKLLKNVELCDARLGASLPGRRVAVRECWLAENRGGQAIFLFEGSDSISDAEKLVGLEVRIPLAERVQLPSGSYYVSDLIGCEVREKGEAIGVVHDVQFTGAAPLLVVDSPRGELLIPLAQEICVNVDVEKRLIDAVLPEGLRELNLD